MAAVVPKTSGVHSHGAVWVTNGERGRKTQKEEKTKKGGAGMKRTATNFASQLSVRKKKCEGNRKIVP